MEVYIEYVIFDNYVIDITILALLCKTLSFRPSKLRLLCSASFGVVCAILMPFVSVGVLALFAIKLAVGVVMVLLLRRHKSFVEYMVSFVLFMTYTFVLGGACFGLSLMFGGSAVGVLVNAYQIPMGAIVLIVYFYIYLLFKLISYLKHKGKNLSLYYDVVITIKDKKYYVRGYIDSGNNIFDDGKPVVVFSRSAFAKTFKEFPLQNLLLCKTQNIPFTNAHFVDYHTASGVSQMLIFDVDKIELKNSERSVERSDVLVGVGKTNMFSNSFDCLLNNDFM